MYFGKRSGLWNKEVTELFRVGVDERIRLR